MEYLQKQSRTQLTLYTTCLDDMVGPDNTVRAIDGFVNGLDLEKLGFATIAPQGRPPYDPADLLKLYIYGYMNRMRSSRRLELECGRNIEVIWLLGNLSPDHNTIARFRKDNPKAIKRAFRATVSMARNHDLIGAALIAGDSTKLRAQNSKKNNYSKKKVARHIEYIDKKLAEHARETADADGDRKEELQREIGNRKAQRKKYTDIRERLESDTTTENPQISTSDPDSRHQIVRGAVTEVCYTAQTTVDADHKLLIDYEITNRNDKKAPATDERSERMAYVCCEGQSPSFGPTPSPPSTTRDTIPVASSRSRLTWASTPWWPYPRSDAGARPRTLATMSNVSYTTRGTIRIHVRRATN